MERGAALDVLALIAVGAATELCEHPGDGACLTCCVSVEAAMWSAIDSVGVPAWPAPVPTDATAHGASL